MINSYEKKLSSQEKKALTTETQLKEELANLQSSMQSTITSNAQRLKDQFEAQVTALKKEVLMHENESTEKARELEDNFRVQIKAAIQKEKQNLNFECEELYELRIVNESVKKRNEELEKMVAGLQKLAASFKVPQGGEGGVEIHVIPAPKVYEAKFYADKHGIRRLRELPLRHK